MAKIKTIILFFLFLKWCAGFDIPRSGCLSDLYINNDQYNITDTYHIGDSIPTEAHYDEFGNLFFVESGRNDQGYHFTANMVRPETSVPVIIPGLPNDATYSIAIDRKDTKVYFGTGHGIYRYDYETHFATPVSKSSLQLDMIFIDSDGNKYITEPREGTKELFLLNGEKKIRFESLEALNELTIDDKNNFYYIKDKQLFVLRSTLSTPVSIGNVSREGKAQIAVRNDYVFVANDDLLYIHGNETGNLKVVYNSPKSTTAIAFDKTGDFVLGVPGKILKYGVNECPFRKD